MWPGGSLVSGCSLGPPQAKTKGNKVNVGVKYAEKQERKFEPEKLREGRNIIGLQVLALPHLGLAAELSGEVAEARRAPRSLRLWGTGYLALAHMYGGHCAYHFRHPNSLLQQPYGVGAVVMTPFMQMRKRGAWRS